MNLLEKIQKALDRDSKFADYPGFPDWDTSATLKFNPEDLRRIRDDHPEELTDLGDVHDILTELFVHGHLRKAAIMIRSEVGRNPGFRSEVLACVKPKSLAEHLLGGNLLKLRRSPNDF